MGVKSQLLRQRITSQAQHSFPPNIDEGKPSMKVASHSDKTLDNNGEVGDSCNTTVTRVIFVYLVLYWMCSAEAISLSIHLWLLNFFFMFVVTGLMQEGSSWGISLVSEREKALIVGWFIEKKKPIESLEFTCLL